MSNSMPFAPVETLFSLGANLGEPRATLQRALDLLEAEYGPLVQSSFYETPPWGDAEQPAFLNVVVRGVACVAPLTILRRCKEIEQELGRLPTHRWGPRAIDVDLLAYGAITLMTPDLTLPHPRLSERGFVLVPLDEIAPDWRHPLLDRTARELLDALPEADVRGVTRLGSAAR
ncbi:MAG: 2-amino-4-hydroxy-6-hydroxymethyldihydropteridine diphosphokinase [Chloroflexota bacterium]